MTIAITTPTGTVGRKLVARLLDEGHHELVLLARDPSKLAQEQARGARVVRADLTDAAAVRRATEGVDALFWVNPPDAALDDFIGYSRRLARNAAEAARANGIPHVVLLSSIGAHLGPGVGPISGLHEAEKILREAVPALTILRPTFFMENFIMSAGSIAEARSVFMPIAGGATLPMVATVDIAAAAARVLTQPPLQGARVVPIHGPRDYSFAEATRIIGEAIGETVAFVQVTPEQTREALRGFGISDHMAGLYLEMYAAMSAGRLVAEHPRTAETTTPTRMEEFSRQVLAPMLQSQP